MLNISRNLSLGISGTLILIATLTACSATEEMPVAKISPSKTSPMHREKMPAQILANLKRIAETSQKLMLERGITETYYVNSNVDTRTSTSQGPISWTTAFDPTSKKTLSRYPGNPTYREQGSGPQAVKIALGIAHDYLAGDPVPSEDAGIYTFPMKPEDKEVVVIYTRNDLVTGVLVEDTLKNPSFTNFYEVNAYNATNAIANRVLHSKR